jgi:uncharacterized damage-inducible protein DinB
VDPSTIQFLWQYMVHADGQMLAAAATVSDEGYRREQNISFGTVEKQINHCILAQECWLKRLHGQDVLFVDLAPLPREQIGAKWGEVHQGLLAFAEAQTEQTLSKVIRFTSRLVKRYELPVWAGMLHAADHASYHRGQLNSMIKLAGGKPSGVMLTTYIVQANIGKEMV